MSALSKYKQLLEEKISSTGGKDFLPFFNPNKLIKASKRGNGVVRILPRDNNEMFFYQYKKHSYKVGTAYKNYFCPMSLTSSGEVVGTSCPFCDFVKENKEILDKAVSSKLNAKDSYTMAVYNYVDDEIQKYEVNYYGMTDILTAMQKLDEDFDPDIEGFDLFFEKDKEGYAKAVSASASEVSLKELAKEADGFDGKLPDVEQEAIPSSIEKYMKTINTAFDYAVKAFAPTFASPSKKGKKVEVEDDDEDNEVKTVITKKGRTYDPNEDDNNEQEDEKPTTKKKIAVEEDDDGDDDEISDIKNFLKNRKK